MRAFLVFLGFAGLLALGAQAEPIADSGDADAITTQILIDCLKGAERGQGERAGCIGVMVAACSETAMTTVEQLACIEPELAFWETRMMAAYNGLLDAYGAEDVEFESIRAVAPILRNTQLTWRTWRDAKCGFEYGKYRGGSLGRVTSAYCRLDETAERSLELDADLVETY